MISPAGETQDASRYYGLMGILRPEPLPDTEVSRIVETKLRWILESCEPVAVWLFGSAAADAMTVASDIDLASVVPVRAGRRRRDTGSYVS